MAARRSGATDYTFVGSGAQAGTVSLELLLRWHWTFVLEYLKLWNAFDFANRRDRGSLSQSGWFV